MVVICPQCAAFVAVGALPEGCSKLVSLQIKEYCQLNVTMTM